MEKAEPEVKILNRTQKHQLRSILLGTGSNLHGHGHGRGCLSSAYPSESAGTGTGVTATVGLTSNLTSHSILPPIPLPIYTAQELQLRGEKAFRVADQEIEALLKNKMDHIFAHGEENLRDLQQSLLKEALVPVPAVEEIEEERYNQIYALMKRPMQQSIQTPQKRFLVRTTGPPPSCGSSPSASGSSGGEEFDFDYDLDEEDEEFLSKQREKDAKFRVTDGSFESVITWFLTHRVESPEDFAQLKLDILLPPRPQTTQRPPGPTSQAQAEGQCQGQTQPLRPYRPYPFSLLSPSELDVIISYFLAKQKKSPTSLTASPPIWQPIHISQPASPLGHGPSHAQGRKSLSSPSNKKQRPSLGPPPSPKSPAMLAYKIFRPPIPKYEPKVLRSHNKQSAMSLAAIHKLKSKADCLQKFTTHFKGAMRYQFLTGVQQRKAAIRNVQALEEAWEGDENWEGALGKFVFRKRSQDAKKMKVDANNNVVESGASTTTTPKRTSTPKPDNNNNVAGTGSGKIQCSSSCSRSSSGSAKSKSEQVPEEDKVQKQQLPLPIPTLREISDVISSVSTPQPAKRMSLRRVPKSV